MPPRRLTANDPSIPLYQQVADSLRGDIENGFYAVGSSLPTENQLCDQFDISRHTARDALRLLEQAGYVSRRRGAGTYVESNRPKAKYVQMLSSIDDLFRYAHETRFEIEDVRRLKASQALADFLICEPGAPLIRLRGRRFQALSSRPFSLTELYLARRFDSALDAIVDHRGPICALIEEHFKVRIARIGQDIQAINLTKAEAERLDVKDGAAALKVVRRYYEDDGSLIEVSSNLYPGTRFTYTSWLDREEKA
ncbi:MAG: GntR family transcriptional regulator [Sphingomonadales bacterium]|nr:GntR family transcriptional regulator [Sphingomonadales bacterium]